jgi:hypothetical protein
LEDAFAGFPLIDTRPASQASFATVLRLIRRDTFKNLSSLIVIPSYPLPHTISCKGKKGPVD